jgi:Ribbon-helix-helix domain
MQKPRPALVRVTAPIVLTVMMLLSVRSAHAEVLLGELMRKCLLLENYWALKLTQDTTGSTPNDGSAVCFGYLLAFRGLQGAVIGTDCASTQSCRKTSVSLEDAFWQGLKDIAANRRVPLRNLVASIDTERQPRDRFKIVAGIIFDHGDANFQRNGDGLAQIAAN